MVVLDRYFINPFHATGLFLYQGVYEDTSDIKWIKKFCRITVRTYLYYTDSSIKKFN